MRNWLLLICDRRQRVEGNANLSNSPEQKISSIHGNMGTKFCLSECRCSLMSLWKLRRNRIDWFVLSLLESHQCSNWDGVVCSLNSREDSWGFLLITILTIYIYYEEFLCVLIWQKHWRFCSLHCYLQGTRWCTICCWFSVQLLDKQWRGSTCVEACNRVAFNSMT